MKVRLTKIVSSHDRLRFPSVEGDLVEWPVVGARIHIIGISPTPGADRHVITTPVKKIAGEVIHTANSVYRLEKI